MASKNGKEVIITDSLILYVGQKWSTYYDLNKIRRDSLAEADFRKKPMKSLSLNTNQDALQARLEAKSEIIEIIDESKGESMPVFKNREKHNIIVFDKGPLEGFDILTNHKLTEVIPPQEWKITKDTLIVLGYICNKGTSTFRGRTYHAWFTVDRKSCINSEKTDLSIFQSAFQTAREELLISKPKTPLLLMS